MSIIRSRIEKHLKEQEIPSLLYDERLVVSKTKNMGVRTMRARNLAKILPVYLGRHAKSFEHDLKLRTKAKD